MQVLKPSYYDKFRCIGKDCKDTCCIGWKIQIDKKSYNKYKKVKGEFGRYLNGSIKRNRNKETDLFYGEIKLENGRCPLLNEHNLCEVYINLGEEFLCNTCKIYPRFIRKYGDIYEKSLSLSCPEVSKILVDLKEDFAFNMEHENLKEVEMEYVTQENYNTGLYNMLWEGRSLSIQVAQFKELEIWKRLIFIKLIEEKLQNLIYESTYNNLDNVIRNLTNTITSYDVIKSFDNIKKVNTIKVLFIRMILQKSANLGKTSDKFWDILKEFNILFEGQNEISISDLLDDKENEFNNYFEEYDYIFENYIVYNLYNNYMKCLITKDLNKEVLILILKYSIIKILLLAKWNANNKALVKEDIIDVLYSFSRVIEHNDVFLNDLYKEIKEAEYDTLAYLTILVR